MTLRALRGMLAVAGFLLGNAITGHAQSGSPAPALAIEPAALWAASWIADPAAHPTDYGVFHFRKRFTLTAKPDAFVVRVSADNRYRLFVNGTSVSVGPARGDPMHWRYETVDLAPWLRAGANVLAAVVWNFGEWRPVAQMSVRTGFILQGRSAAEAVVNSDASWRVWHDDAYAPLPVDREKLNTYIVVGPGVRIDGRRYPWGWQEAEFDDRGWATARVLGRGSPRGAGTDVTWWLVPRTIPAVEETPQRGAQVRRSSGVTPGAGFLAGREPLVVPAHAEAVLLVDWGSETTAYPRLRTSGGRGGSVTLTYAEALVDAAGAKGNRNEIDGRAIRGPRDRFEPDGGPHREFAPLWYRTFRYIEVAVRTADEPLTIEDLHAIFTAYPFRAAGHFACDDPELMKIWDVGWHTARLCAFETYMDCPYYEQLQYVGDTRIQALVSLYGSGDDRLMRNAIEQYDDSRIPEGLTQSRYPSATPQIIPPFSLFWIEMVHDYAMHRDDPAFVREKLPGIEAVLAWFDRHIDAQTGMLGRLPYWNFVDWTEEWPWSEERQTGGQPPGAAEGGSSILTLQFAIALRHAAVVFTACGEESRADACRRRAEALTAATMARCWDERRALLADTPEKKTFSQHANALAVLAGALATDRARELMRRVLDDASLTRCTYYFQFYLLRAMKAAGLGDRYVARMQPWRDMLARGLTTFAERPDPTRSDCHAWSASPTYELLATVCGIGPGSPGFKTVRIEPHPGALTHVEGVVPHPQGAIELRLTHEGDAIHGTITLPTEVTGEFIWRGQSLPLHGGKQEVAL
jgi:hypothetical protein